MVRESIDRFAVRLQTDSRQWLVWNEFHETVLASPKDETQLSQLLALHLEYELTGRHQVAVNREVVVGRDRFIDIHAELNKPDADGWTDPISVCIEVKGCWHREIWRAMEKQLRDLYMAKGVRERGLYVVFWFFCDYWVEESRREDAIKMRGKHDLPSARKRLEKQAEKLSLEWGRLEAVIIDAGLDGSWPASLRKQPKKRGSAK